MIIDLLEFVFTVGIWAFYLAVAILLILIGHVLFQIFCPDRFIGQTQQQVSEQACDCTARSPLASQDQQRTRPPSSA